MRIRSSFWRSHVAMLGGVLLMAALLPGAVVAADPAAGFDATWTVTRPDGITVRDDGAISVGDDLALVYAAVDGTAVTRCRLTIETADAYVQVAGVITDGECRLSMRLPDFPNPTYRARWDPGFQDICVYATLWFADDETRSMIPADHLQPGGQPCGNPASQIQNAPRLHFDVDEAGATPDRPFVSDPTFLSWDPTDWDTGMQPLRFGETWHVEVPDWVEACSPSLIGTWQTSLRALYPPGCATWDVRVPGVLPEGVQFIGDQVWDANLFTWYTVEGQTEEYSVHSGMAVPLAATDGIFESDLPAVFPTDLARTRFVTIGEPWTPSYQVSGTTATKCRMELNDNQGNDFANYEVVPDANGLCSFDVPAMEQDERHQYYVYAFPESDPTSWQITFGGSIEAIPAPEPPVIEPPVIEPEGETGIEVEPGDGQGLVVDLEVVPDDPAPIDCADQAIAPDLSVGGDIPTLEVECDLAPGDYTATATMIDAAGTSATAVRSFTVPYPSPVVVGRGPVAGAVGVARDARPSVTFDMGVSGVNGTSMRLADSSGAFVPASVAYDAATRTATLTPSGLLTTSRTYRVHLSSAIKSAATGQAISPTSWSFTTTADATAPTIVGRVPAVNATGVSRAISPAVRFSESVKGVTGSNIQLRDVASGAYVPAVVTYDAGQRRATLDPTGTLAPNRRYLVIVRSSVLDIVGNPATTATWTFTTGVGGATSLQRAHRPTR